jgi:branched-chain amino acid transport system ATP-binding protein
MSLLEIDKMNVYHGEVHTLKDVSLHIEEGELVSIVGSNGSGKSTTINAISGLIETRSGEIKFLDQRIDGLELHEISSMGVIQIPEGRRLFPHMTVNENLEIGAYSPRPRTLKNKTFEEVYSLFPLLEERKHQLARTLSGGEQQMLAIGRGLMAKPKLLILDEPSLGLAPILVKEIFKTIDHINQGGTTILLVEQDVQISLSLSHRGYVLENGRIVMEGAGLELLQNPRIKEAYLGM